MTIPDFTYNFAFGYGNLHPAAGASRDNPSDPGTPVWWLRKLVSDLLDRQLEYDIREDYVLGYHPLPKGDRRYIRALNDFQHKARTNYIGLVTSAPVERMRPVGFRFGPVGEADQDAKKIWSANDMDFQAPTVQGRAAIFGVSYTLVSPVPDGEKWPVITAEDPRMCITYQDPNRPSKSLAGMKMWADDLTGKVLAILYMPDTIYGFVGPQASTVAEYDTQHLKQALLSYAGGFEPGGVVTNTLGEVPLVPYYWRPDTIGMDIPLGECGPDIRDIQDRINHTVLDRLIISRQQAYNQRWATGMELPRDKKGQAGKPPFDPGSDTLWVTKSENARFGQFSAADIRQVLEAVRDDVADIAAITKTPSHYLMGRMANVSGETLAQAETGLVSKCRVRMAAMGWGHERTMKLCFKYLGQTDKFSDVEAETLWADPERRTVGELADAGLKWTQAGVPLELVMQRQGFSPEEIAFAVQKRHEADQRELQLAVNRDIRATAMAPEEGTAAPGGTPGSAPSPSAGIKPAVKPTPSNS